MKTIQFKDKEYPLFQSLGNAAQFAIPFAKHFCTGFGVDIGCNKKLWAFPDAIPIDLLFNDDFNALNIPHNLDYIFSSHCLLHVDDWVLVMEYWHLSLRHGGILFLYLPDYSQLYWRPWNNRKHKHALKKLIVKDYMRDKYNNIFCSLADLNNSYMIVGEKK